MAKENLALHLPVFSALKASGTCSVSVSLVWVELLTEPEAGDNYSTKRIEISRQCFPTHVIYFGSPPKHSEHTPPSIF